MVTDKSGEVLEPARHGLNRDAVRVALLGSQVGIIAVADGCGLTYWSEIAAHIAVNEFIIHIEKRLASEHAPYSPTAMKTILKEAIHSVNLSMLSWKHPKLKSKFNVLDKGGNTTLVAAIIFPYTEDDTTQNKETRRNSDTTPVLATPTTPSTSSNNTHTEPSQLHKDKFSEAIPESPAKAPTRKHSNARAPEPDKKFGVVFTGMGDSELYLFKVHDIEKPITKSKSNSISVPAPPLSSPSLSTGELPRKQSIAPAKTDSSLSNSTDNLKARSHSKTSPRRADTSPSTSLPASTPESSESSGKYPKHGSKTLRDKKVSKSKLSASSPGSSKRIAHKSNTYRSPPSNPSSPLTEEISPLTRDFDASISASQEFDTKPAKPSYSPLSERRYCRTGSVDKKKEAKNSGAPSDALEPQTASSLPKADLKTSITFSAPPTSPETRRKERRTYHQPSSSEPSSSSIQASSIQTSSHATSPSESTSLKRAYSETPTAETNSVAAVAASLELDRLELSEGSATPRRKHVRSASEPTEEEEDGISNPSSNTSQSLPAHQSVLLNSSISSKDSSLRDISHSKEPEPFKDPSSDSLDVGSAAPAAATSTSTTSRPTRYSKSFSDIPSFESLAEDGSMNRSESLHINLLSAHNVKHSEEEALAHSPSATSSEMTTPRLPCGTWSKILTDSGKSPFIPFPGLKDRSIPEPKFLALNPGDAIFACSDGVASSYPDGNIIWPEIQIEQYECKEGLDHAVNALIQSTMHHHTSSHTDPDDVTIGAIKVTNFAKKKKPGDLRVAPSRDHTSTFSPLFAASQYADRNYLLEYLSEYPKPKEKNPS